MGTESWCAECRLKNSEDFEVPYLQGMWPEHFEDIKGETNFAEQSHYWEADSRSVGHEFCGLCESGFYCRFYKIQPLMKVPNQKNRV
jgi:hypothetical protein